jgi:hypothetical protein
VLLAPRFQTLPVEQFHALVNAATKILEMEEFMADAEGACSRRPSTEPLSIDEWLAVRCSFVRSIQAAQGTWVRWVLWRALTSFVDRNNGAQRGSGLTRLASLPHSAR